MNSHMSLRLAAAASAWIATAAPLSAQTAEDQVQALSTCVELSTNGKDRLMTAHWLTAALASVPQLADIVTVDPAKKEQLDKQMAQLFTRLLTVDCQSEAKAMFRSGNGAKMQEVGGALGEIAMRELFGDKDAVAAVSSYTKYLDEKDFDVLKN